MPVRILNAHRTNNRIGNIVYRASTFGRIVAAFCHVQI
jgi:hypothetical protein